jgi:hypothetical protein
MPSTVIRAILYDAEAKDLVIRFQTGRCYAYEDVPPDTFEAMQAAFSKGEFFNTRIRDRFRFRRLEDASDEPSAANVL